MSFIDNLKGTLKSLIGSKTDKVVEESKIKMEVAPTPTVEVMQQPTEEVIESTPEVMMDMPAPVVHVEPTIDTAVDNVTVAIDTVTADLENIHTENH